MCVQDATEGKLGNPKRLLYEATMFLNWLHTGELPMTLYEMPCDLALTFLELKAEFSKGPSG